MMMDGARRMMQQETLKPKNVSATVARFASYFRPYWPAVLLVAIFMIVATWAQVTVAEIPGQAVDCYLFQRPGSNCTYTTQDAKTIDANPALDTQAKKDAKIQGVLSLVVRFVGLMLLSAVCSGLMFFSMTWAGQNALWRIRVEVFRHVHRLSLGYYAENEAGDIMSRFTNDSETIQQVLGFALVQVLSSALLIVWIVVKMMQANIGYALLSLSIVPVMAIATVYFSTQARKAFRKSRAEMGAVNANLQENIAGVREAQAFNREEENIANFKQSNALNRDANIRAASFTSALSPALEALGYVAMMIVVVVGGLAVLRNQPLLGTTISLGTIFTFLIYVQRFNQPIQQVSVLWTNIQSAIAGGERIFGLLDQKPDLVNRPNAKEMPKISGKVEFVDVTAEYQEGQPVLKGINLKT